MGDLATTSDGRYRSIRERCERVMQQWAQADATAAGAASQLAQVVDIRDARARLERLGMSR